MKTQIRLLKSAEVMAMFRQKTRSGFWQFVYANAVPHVRIGPRTIVFDEQQLTEWLRQRTVGVGCRDSRSFASAPLSDP